MHLTYRWQATLVIALGLLMAILDNTIVSVVLPQMTTAFHTDFQTITRVGTGYFLAQAAVIPIVGYLSDRIGSKIRNGTPAVATTARYAPPNREQIKHKLRNITL